LYWEYTSAEEFSAFLRSHLEIHLQAWGKSWGDGNGTVGENGTHNGADAIRNQQMLGAPAHSSCDDKDEPGLFDLAETANAELALALDSINAIGSALQGLTVEMNRAGADIKAANNPIAQPNPQRIASFINGIADRMEAFALRLDTETPNLAEHYARGFQAVSQSIGISQDFEDQGRKQVITLVQTIKRNDAIILAGNEQLAGFRNIVSGLPRMTTALNRAKRHMVASIDSLEKEFNVIINLTKELERVAYATWPGIELQIQDAVLNDDLRKDPTHTISPTAQ